MHTYKLYFDQENGRVYSDGILIGTLNHNEKLILVHLIENQGSICTKEVLISIGWPNRIVVPNSLNIAIKKIRGVFENAKKDLGAELETVPKIGFRLNSSLLFLDKLEYESSSESLQVKKVAPTPYSTSHRKKSVFSYTTLIFSLLLLSMCLWVLIISHTPIMTCTSDREKEITVCGNAEHDKSRQLLPRSTYWFIKNDEGDYEYIKVK
ncbi:transcriptional regulator [Aeromonas dhakensis]|uniref:winged helix-turn-helix domain-containing protein n=1 Tax=Aeromonas dhakensis TaxID=196024 RepID=UPI00398744DF